MKFSENTLTILKNFSSINSGLVLRKGKIQRTMSPEKSILVEAEIEDDIPEQFGIYDLSQFLGTISTLGEPSVKFNPTSVLISDGEVELNYYSCSPSVIVSPPDKELSMSKIDASFVMTSTALQKLLKLAAMNNLSHLTVLSKNGELRLQTHEMTNDTSNYASIKIGEHNGGDFTATFKTENFRLLSDDYDVEVMVGGFAKFTSKNKNVKYWIALEANKK